MAYGPRVVVVDPPADPQDERVGGVILPPGMGLHAVNKGVVVEVGQDVPLLSKGCMVYYPHGSELEIGDVKILMADRIIAYEEA